jgi:hypothetical protein
MMIYGGHSAMGLIAAREISQQQSYPFITTVSKRGYPEGLGPGSAMMEALCEGETPHYMAKCDLNDPVAVKCLWEWGPQAEESVPPVLLPFDALVMNVRSKAKEWSGTGRGEAVKLLEEMTIEVQTHVKKIKQQMKEQERSDPDLDQRKLLLEEREADVTEAVADVLAIKEGAAVGVASSAEQSDLAALRKGWTEVAGRLTGWLQGS